MKYFILVKSDYWSIYKHSEFQMLKYMYMQNLIKIIDINFLLYIL